MELGDKMKKVVKIGIILIILFSIITQLNICNAAALINTNTYQPAELGDEKGLVEKANVIASAIRNVGIVVAVIALMVIGIKTMVGSAEEKAEYKKSIPGYLIGVVLVVAMSLIPSIITTIVSEMG